MKVTYVNENEMKKNKYTLRKIAAIVGLMAPLLLTGCGKTDSLDDIRDKYLTGDHYDYDENEQLTIHDLMHYEQAYEAYQNDNSNENKQNLHKETMKLEDVANRFITRKLNTAMGTDYNFTGDHRETDEILYANGEYFTDKIPNEIESIIRNTRFLSNNKNIDNLNDKELDEFFNNGKTLYSLILKHLDTDYEYDGNKIKVSEEDTSQNVR